MNSKKETFASLLASHGYRYDLRPVFDDFLTLTLCAYSHNPITRKSYDEDLYMQIIGKYPKELARELFPHLLALLAIEMEERVGKSEGTDVLGEFYELNFCRKGSGQFFTPWHVCTMMAEMLYGENVHEETERLRVLDSSCGSGRTLLAGAQVLGWKHSYYGIDIDHTCVKMTALTLFLNGVFRGEVMCADALSPTDFRVSYKLSFLPFGIFRIEKPEHSWLWQAQQATFRPKEKQTAQRPEIILPSEEDKQGGQGWQLQLF